MPLRLSNSLRPRFADRKKFLKGSFVDIGETITLGVDGSWITTKSFENVSEGHRCEVEDVGEIFGVGVSGVFREGSEAFSSNSSPVSSINDLPTELRLNSTSERFAPVNRCCKRVVEFDLGLLLDTSSGSSDIVSGMAVKDLLLL